MKMKILCRTALLVCLITSTLAIAPNSFSQGKSLSLHSSRKHPVSLVQNFKTFPNSLQAAAVATPQSEQKLQISPVSEALAGFVVSLATLPKAIAFSTVLGVSPLTGIWTTVAVSLAVTIFGQSPGLISGVAGVLIMPMAAIMKKHGPAAMSAAVILSGILEILFGALKLGKHLDIVTENVVVGFLNAVVVFLLKTQVIRIC